MKTIALFGAWIGATAALGINLGRLNWPPQLWEGRAWLLVSLPMVVFGWNSVDAILRQYGRIRGRKAARLEAARLDGEKILKGTLVAVQQRTGIDYRRICIHLFLVTRKWQLRRPFTFRHQRAVSRVRLSEYPPPSGITWTEGKGVIGKCWRKKQFQVRDLRSEYDDVGDVSESDWEKKGLAEQFGLTYKEFRATERFAGTILVAPILDVTDVGTRYMGCVSLDAPGKCYDELQQNTVRHNLQLAANSIGALLKRASGS